MKYIAAFLFAIFPTVVMAGKCESKAIAEFSGGLVAGVGGYIDPLVLMDKYYSSSEEVQKKMRESNPFSISETNSGIIICTGIANIPSGRVKIDAVVDKFFGGKFANIYIDAKSPKGVNGQCLAVTELSRLSCK